MQIFENETKGLKALVFLDLEATAFTAEMIEIGAYLATLNPDGSIKKVGKPFKHYVKAHHPIGWAVTKLTGITEEKLRENGEDFGFVLSEFRKYVGKYWNSCRFVTFGEHDIVIVKNTMVEHKDTVDPSYARQIYRHHWDFQKTLGTYVQDEHGNPLSLKNYLKVFQLEFDGTAHDAIYDALNTLDLYQAARIHPEILAEEYQKVLQNLNSNKVGKPIKTLIKMLNEGKTVTPEMWDLLIKETFR